MTASIADQWRRLALAALRRSGDAGEDTPPEQVDDLLATTTYDGIRLDALYTPDSAGTAPAGLPGQPPYVRGGRASGGLVGGWDVRQRHCAADPARVRAAILDDLTNGATSIWLTLGGTALPFDALPAALDGVHLDMAGVVLDAGDDFAAAAAAWFRLLADRGTDPGVVTGNLGADPLGRRASTGDSEVLAGALTSVVSLAARCATGTPGVRAITVDATVYHDAGGSDAEELGCAAAAGVAYLRALTEGGLSVPAALGQLEFRYAATADQFATIAKLRAARRIWARIAEMSGAPADGGQIQHAVTSAAMMTVRDPSVNLLRTTVAAFAAGVGGADAITVLPFDHQLGGPEDHSRRLARNTQALLIEESHLARVLDPAGGSYYVERYTEDLARAAWDWFIALEQAGGLAAALDSGLVADRIERTWQLRAAAIAHRWDPITGVSEFPALGEQPSPRRRALAPMPGGLPRRRYAQVFEDLRDRADAQHEVTGSRPTVMLVTFGSPAAIGPRVDFVTNLFAAGGIAVTSVPAADVESMDGDVWSSVVCLCGPDRVYAEDAEPVAKTLRAAGAERVWLAGRGDHSWADGHLHVGCDAVAALTTTLADLGVPE